jgi:hypothetical protein
MNKRNFFKGLVALLAMPSTIYARIVSKPKAPSEQYFFNIVEGGFVKEAYVDSFKDVRVGMLFTTTRWWGVEGGTVFEVTGISPDHSEVMLVAPRSSMKHWPKGSSRLIGLPYSNVGQFTFYVRA